MAVSAVTMVSLGLATVFILGGRALAKTSVRLWEVPADQRGWREDQLAGMYVIAGVLTLVALGLWLVSLTQ